jgi:hypothetical protein
MENSNQKPLNHTLRCPHCNYSEKACCETIHEHANSVRKHIESKHEGSKAPVHHV